MVTHRTAAPSSAPGATRLRRHAWIAVLAVGTVLFVAVERTLVATQNPNLVPAAILLGAAVVPAAFVAFISGRRLPYTVTGTVIGAAAFLGGVIGLVVAGTLEFDVGRDLGGLPMIGVGLIEETSKLIIPAAILLVPRYRTPANGLLIGVAAGAGFAALETMGYAFTTLLQSRGSITDTVDELLLRGFLSPAGHMAWTGVAAAALYTAATAPGRRGRRIGGFVGAFVVAVALHALWDSQKTLIGTLVIAVLSLAALGWTVHRVHRAAAADQPIGAHPAA